MASVFIFWRDAAKGDAEMVGLPGFCRAGEVRWVVGAGGSLHDVVDETNPTVWFSGGGLRIQSPVLRGLGQAGSSGTAHCRRSLQTEHARDKRRISQK